MIKPKELRIGNYVFDKGWEAERPIGATDIYDMVIKGSENYEPIKINCDWLVKFGFRYDRPGIQGADMWQGLGYWSKDDLLFRGNFNSTKPIDLKLAGYFNSDYRFVHQIQNIAYLITGEELTIKTTNTI